MSHSPYTTLLALKVLADATERILREGDTTSAVREALAAVEQARTILGGPVAPPPTPDPAAVEALTNYVQSEIAESWKSRPEDRAVPPWVVVRRAQIAREGPRAERAGEEDEEC